jgi:hypothetical protein
MKYYSLEEVIEIYDNKSNRKKVEILTNALGLMESCNSQSEETVIAKSMGFELKNGYWQKRLKNENT